MRTTETNITALKELIIFFVFQLDIFPNALCILEDDLQADLFYAETFKTFYKAVYQVNVKDSIQFKIQSSKRFIEEEYPITYYFLWHLTNKKEFKDLYLDFMNEIKNMQTVLKIGVNYGKE